MAKRQEIHSFDACRTDLWLEQSGKIETILVDTNSETAGSIIASNSFFAKNCIEKEKMITAKLTCCSS